MWMRHDVRKARTMKPMTFRVLLVSLVACAASAQPARAMFTQNQIGQFSSDGQASLNWTLNGSGNSATLSGTENGVFSFSNLPGARRASSPPR